MSKGVLYGVGTGPGDPELLTIKAVRTIESCPVIAAPQTADGVMVALDLTPEMSSPLHIVLGGYDECAAQSAGRGRRWS